MRKLILAGGLLLLFYQVVTAQSPLHSFSVAYAASTAGSRFHADPFSFLLNPAALATVPTAGAGLFAERRFNLDALRTLTLAAAVPASYGNTGATIRYYGNAVFNEIKASLVFARSLGKKVDVGAQFNYHTLHLSGYGNAAALTGALGFLIHVTERFHTGISVDNPVGGHFGINKEEQLSTVYQFETGYDVSDKLFLHTAVIKESFQPVTVNAALHYWPASQVVTKLGVSSDTGSWWVSAGYVLASFRVEISVSSHPQLGLTPGILLLFNPTKKK